MARFFIAGTNFPNGRAIIRGRDAEHIKVLRLRPGEEMTICDGNGTDYKCRLVRSDKDEAEAEIIEVVPCAAEPTERWNRISEEAAKQSGRGIIPEVRWIDSFVEALDAAKRQEDAFFLYETGERESLRAALKGAEKLGSAALITGPEGGFEPYEADMARKIGLHICSMGARILRCETAPVVALTALMYESGNLE